MLMLTVSLRMNQNVKPEITANDNQKLVAERSATLGMTQHLVAITIVSCTERRTSCSACCSTR